jgi:hypothetical protein
LWKTNIIANGGTISDSILTIFDNYFFKPAKTVGNILDQLDRLNFFAGTGNEIAARTNVISSNFFATKVNSPIWDNSEGYRSGGTGYLNLNYNPFTDGIKLTTNSAFVFCLVQSPTFVSDVYTIGCQAASELQILRIRQQALRLNVYCNRNSGTSGSIAITTAQIERTYIGVIRYGANLESTLYKNIITTGSTSASSNRPNFSMYELTYNSGGTPAGFYDNNFHSISGCGSKDFNIAGFQSIVTTLFAQLGI